MSNKHHSASYRMHQFVFACNKLQALVKIGNLNIFVPTNIISSICSLIIKLAHPGSPWKRAVKSICVCMQLNYGIKRKTQMVHYTTPQTKSCSDYPKKLPTKGVILDMITDKGSQYSTRLPSIGFWSWSQFLPVSDNPIDTCGDQTGTQSDRSNWILMFLWQKNPDC